jgi:CxxC motif-containing protein (DUF1111 family)
MSVRAPSILLLAAVVAGCGSAPAADPSDALLGGDGTIFDEGDEAFAYPARNLQQEKRNAFQIGDAIFNRNWVAAPATAQGSDGLGPTFNAFSCSGCHDNNGRGTPPESDTDEFLGLLLRVSVPGDDGHGGPAPEPAYGDQLQPYGILGVPGEATPHVSYVEVAGSYADGGSYSLRQPTYSVDALAYGPLSAGHMISPRLAPQTVGLGLLEAVDESTILGFQSNGGHANMVWDSAAQRLAVGRFGWKANQPSLEQQVMAASRNDIGITDTRYPTENCPTAQSACAAAPQSMSQPNLEPLREQGLIVHALALAVPARRNLDDARALDGEKRFTSFGCASCHVPKMVTGTLPSWPELSGQTIRPFTDLLLHDLGPGLADGRPDYLASGSEWRTPPLWGLGLVQSINGAQFLMHDGRARGFAEAILWHGGEAESAKQAFRTAPSQDRDALVAFLSSL